MALDRALTVLFLILHILWWPLSKILAILLFILAPFYRVGVFLLLPFIHAGRTILNVLSFPFSVRWLERIEVHMATHSTLQTASILIPPRHSTSISGRLPSSASSPARSCTSSSDSSRQPSTSMHQSLPSHVRMVARLQSFEKQDV